MSNVKNLFFLFGLPLFLFVFFIYILTSAPSVYFGDSGELITAAFTLGVPHPTGFPLYILTGKIFSFLPMGDIGFRINLLSAFFAALTLVVLFFILLILLKKIPDLYDFTLAFILSILFAFTYTIWSQAVLARIYTMNAFFCSILLLLFLYYNDIKKSDKVLYLMAFLTGLGSGIHLTFIIFSFILWSYILIYNFSNFKNKIIFLVFLFLTGFSIYFYIIIRGTSNAILNWYPLKTAEDFLNYITQKQYKQKMFSRELYGYKIFFNYLWNVIYKEFTIVGFFLILIGFIISFIKKYKYFLLFFLIYISNIILLAFYGNYTDLKLAFRYFIPSHLIALIFIFVFLNEIKTYFNRFFFVKFILFAFIFFIAVFLFKQNYVLNNKSNDFIPYFYPQDILSNCEKKSYIFINGDNQIFTIAYFKYVKNKFNEITIFDTSDTIFKDIQILQKQSKSLNVIPNILTALNLKYSPVYTAVPTKAQSYYEPIFGFINKITERPEPDVYYPWKLYSLKNILHNPVNYDFEEREVVGTYLYRYSEYFKNIKKDNIHFYLLENAVKIAYDSVPVLGNVAIIYSEKDKEYDKAEKLIKRALELNPKDESLFFNLGSLHATKREYKLAINCFEKVVSLNPLNFNARLYLERAKQEHEREISLVLQLDKDSDIFKNAKKLMEQKKFTEAIDELKKELKVNPFSAKVNFHIALCYSLINDIKTAIPYYESALKIQPENISILNNLGLCHFKLNDKEKAKTYFEKSLLIDKNQPKIEEIIKKLK